MKAPVKNTLMTALWWLILWPAAFGSFWVMFVGLHDTGDSDGAGFLPITIYAMNPICCCAGVLLSIAVFAVIWFRLLRHTVPVGRGWHPVWTVLWVLLALIGLFGIFVIWFLVLLMNTGIFSTLAFEFWEYYGLVYPIVLALVILIDVIRIARAGRQ